ncbi:MULTISPECIES: VOC family protein [Brevibacterium]|uniref:Glyoxalase superfamily enzyme, possibly 3-demethylubiquinone-9 3-methyltransferase n=2 Tax=Brevibacterium TaxID=1696 RepID=A0A1H1XWW8_BRESA|nr:VOC family protein [Brevibacterium sandarakinum]SDT13625.1 Glyoxalase superfamily enzyme, possibly 3-demethylubiquinone-9 3-methyltransferase [Brevibacterium sandarakinum]
MPTPITPCLWFTENAEEAMEFYCSVFPNSRIVSIERYPDESLDPHYAGMSGKVINGSFDLDGNRFICLDGGPAFTFNEAISLTVECADQAEIDHYWSSLSAVPDSEQCGWLKDKYGISWQIVPANLGELMTGDAQVRALMGMKKIVIEQLVNAD